MLRVSKLILLSTAMIAYAMPAFAHPGHGGDSTFLHGILHPATGLDHLLAALCVGLLAFDLGGRNLFVIPLSFLAAMAAGGLLGAGGIFVPGTEQGIAASVFVLGALIALAVRPSSLFVIPLIATFALFHGFAHATEGAGGGALPLAYFSGILLASAALVGAGILLGAALATLGAESWPRRIGGAAVGFAGLLMLMG